MATQNLGSGNPRDLSWLTEDQIYEVRALGWLKERRIIALRPANSPNDEWLLYEAEDDPDFTGHFVQVKRTKEVGKKGVIEFLAFPPQKETGATSAPAERVAATQTSH